jgi:hypothetical protein
LTYVRIDRLSPRSIAADKRSAVGAKSSTGAAPEGSQRITTRKSLAVGEGERKHIT